MANNKRFFKTISLAHWHVKLSIAAQLPMVLSFRWEQTCELVINVKNNVFNEQRRCMRIEHCRGPLQLDFKRDRSFLRNIKADTHEGFCFRSMPEAHFARPVHTRVHTTGACFMLWYTRGSKRKKLGVG